MTQSRIDTRDAAGRAPLPVVPPRNVQWSTGHHWSGIIAEQYSFRNVDTPEFRAAAHHIAVHLATPARVELTLDGVRTVEMRQPGDISLFPSGISRQVTSPDAHEVLVLSITPEILLETVPTTSLQLMEQVSVR